MYRSLVSCVVASAVGMTTIVPVGGQPVCRPELAVTDVRFSEMIPPALERKWTAIVSVDAARCQPNSSGYFEIVFTRLSEFGPDLEFKERYTWRPPAVEGGIKFLTKEGGEDFRVEDMTPCVCTKKGCRAATRLLKA